jgi:ribonuclease HI
MITYYFDGACWPNPNGHAACGALMKRDGRTAWRYSEYLGNKNTSNNVAEYAGLIAVLRDLLSSVPIDANVIIYGDADLVIKQMRKEWKAGTLTKKEKSGKVPIRPRYYLPFYQEARRLCDQYLNLGGRVEFKWIPREQNTEADELSTEPLRKRGFRESYHDSPQRRAAKEMDDAFEHAISK